MIFRHISTSDPKGLDQAIESSGFIKERIFIQKRRVRREDFDKLNKGLFDYLLELKEKGMSEFEVESDLSGQFVKYDAELLRIRVKKI